MSGRGIVIPGPAALLVEQVDERTRCDHGYPRREVGEMPIARDEHVSLRGDQQRDEVVVGRVDRHLRWIGRVGDPDRIGAQPVENARSRGCRDPSRQLRSCEHALELGEQPWRRDELERPCRPQTEKAGRRCVTREQAGHEYAGVDDRTRHPSLRPFALCSFGAQLRVRKLERLVFRQGVLRLNPLDHVGKRRLAQCFLDQVRHRPAAPGGADPNSAQDILVHVHRCLHLAHVDQCTGMPS